MSDAPLSVLVLEDSKTQASLIEKMLKAANCHVETLLSARELTSSPRLFDLKADAAFIDVHFGAVNGLDLIKPLTERWSGIVLAMMTANSVDDFSVLAKAREAGSHIVVRKPFSMVDVKNVLADVRAIRNKGERRPHVVVLDDSKTICKVAKDLLKTFDYRVSDFQKGEELFQRLNFDHVDVVLTDMNMPGMSGEEMIMLLRDVWPEVGVVAMSTETQANGALDKARAMGVAAILPKPFGADDLANALAMAMGAKAGGADAAETVYL